MKKELASEIVEILEEKLDEMKIKLPENATGTNNIEFRSDLRKELVDEIEDFISINKIAVLS